MTSKMVKMQVVFNEISSKDLLSNSFLQFRPVPSVCGRYIPQIILQKLLKITDIQYLQNHFETDNKGFS